MLLLTDQTMTIPPFLLRNIDGSFKHPGCAVPAFTAAVKPAPDPMAEAIKASRRRDDKMRAMLLHAETLTAKERKTAQDAARKAQKEAEASRLLKNKMKQREVFIQHFKWNHEQ